jgi:hypothetical protein
MAHKTPKVPTTEEVKIGYDGITNDGQGAKITAELSWLAATDPRIRDTLKRMRETGLRLLDAHVTRGERLAILEGVTAGALIYGLHMGLHIGEARYGGPLKSRDEGGT